MPFLKRKLRPYHSLGGYTPKLATPEVMQRIHDVIKDTVVPSWINSVPYNYGKAAAGVLKADEWRNMATIFFPLALISMWGKGSKHQSVLDAEKLRKVLDHTMLLVSTISLVCMHTMTKARSNTYLDCMARYISDLPKLHPNANLKPNHHMSMHVPLFLWLFGPARSWWCFPYEQLIGQIQHLLSNHRIGQMESTLLLSFLKAAKLRRWLSDPQSPPIFKEIKLVFDKIYKSSNSYDDPRNDSSVDQADLDVSTPQSIPDDLKRMRNISESKVFIRARIKLQDISYTCSQTHLGNSLVHFYPDGDRSKPVVPGRIKYIYSADGILYAFALQRQISLPHDPFDPFAQYLHFPAKTYSSKYSSSLEHVDIDWVFCHYARWDVSPDHSVVLSLSRVSCSLRPSVRFAVLLSLIIGMIIFFSFVFCIAESQFMNYPVLHQLIASGHPARLLSCPVPYSGDVLSSVLRIIAIVIIMLVTHREISIKNIT